MRRWSLLSLLASEGTPGQFRLFGMDTWVDCGVGWVTIGGVHEKVFKIVVIPKFCSPD